MALSAETQAIIDELKNQGDLIRNSGTNSVRAVNIKMDRFEGLFTSINDNLIAQTNILTSQLSAAQQKASQEETRRQYEELTPPGSTGDTAPTGRDAMEQRLTSAIDNKMKDFSLLGSMKDLALATAGIFIGYNFLKGAIDEATGGGFTKFEGGIVNFGKQLSEIDLPSIAGTLTALNASVASLTATIDGIKKSLEDIDLGNILYVLGAAFTGLSTLLTGVRLWAYSKQKASEARMKTMMDDFKKYVDDLKSNPNNKFDPNAVKLPGGLDDVAADTNPIRLPGTDADVNRTGGGGFGDGPGGIKLPSVETESYAPKTTRRGTPSPRRGGNSPQPQQKLTFGQRLFSLSPNLDMNDPNVKSMVRKDFLEKFGDQGYRTNSAGRIIGPDSKYQADQKLLDSLANSLDPQYSKWFKAVVKGLGFLGIAFTVYEAYMLYGLLSSDAPDDVKEDAIVGFIGSFIGAASLGAAAGLAGAPFGGWTGLITGALGAGLGAFAGPAVARYIWAWAKGEKPTAEQQALGDKYLSENKVNEIAGMSSEELVEHFAQTGQIPMGSLTKEVTPKRRRGSGGKGSLPGRLDPTRPMDFKLSPRFGYESGLDIQQELPNYLLKTSYMAGGGARDSLLTRMASLGGSGGNVIINAPQNVSPVVNNVEGGKSISHVQVANFGGGGGFGMGRDDPYNLSFV